jgi:hypothetical protein
LLTTFAIVAGCSHVSREQRMSRAPEYPTTSQPAPIPPGTPVPSGSEVAPIPGHPAVRTSGIVDSFNESTGVLTFRDGRMVQLTPESLITLPAEAPRQLSPGLPVAVENVLPVGVRTVTTVDAPVVAGTNQFQRMGTVQSVDRVNEVVRLTDGASIQMSSQANVRMGVSGAPVGIQAVRPGDEVVYVVSDPSSKPADITEMIIFRPAAQ